MSPKEEIIALMRGFYALPVITTLEQQGLLAELRSTNKLNVADLDTAVHVPTLTSMLNYLSKINLLVRSGDTYTMTALGSKVFSRSGGFLIMHSYHEYMEKLSDLLSGKAETSPIVDRVENVIGSALIHKKKYFCFIPKLLEGEHFDSLIDIACGTGEFLHVIQKAYPDVAVAGIDLDPLAIKMSRENLPANTRLIASDGLNMDEWAPKVASITGDHPIFSMWFFLHEIFAIGVSKVAELFIKLRATYPNSYVLIGEIVDLPIDQLAIHHSNSISPEFLFFHELSGQCVASWDQYEQLLSQIPYRICKQILFDEVEGIPSSFIWYLKPSDGD